MKTLTFISILFCSLTILAQTDAAPTPTVAKEKCSTNFPGFMSILDPKAKALKDITPETRDEQKKEVKQTAILRAKDVSVTFKIGGCEHMVYSFTFEGVKSKGKGPFAIFSAAESLMESTPVIKGDHKKEQLIDALEKGKVVGLKQKDARTFSLPCGGARCQLDGTEVGKIVLSYDMAL